MSFETRGISNEEMMYSYYKPSFRPQTTLAHIYIYIWNVLCDFDACEFIYIASNSKRYIFHTVYALDFLFSTLHTTPFLYAKIHFGVLHLLRDSIATFDTPPGSNPP